LVNNLGDIVYQNSYDVFAPNVSKIVSAVNLSTGIYYLVIETPSASVIKKIVVY